jgi:hypothetical protein
LPGAEAVVLDPDVLAHLIEQAGSPEL